MHEFVLAHRFRRLRPGKAHRLTHPEQTCVLIQDIDFHVLEAGLRSWVGTVAPKAAVATVDALRRIGATEMAQIVRRASALRTELLRCEKNEEEEYQALMRRAQLAKQFAVLTEEYRGLLKPTFALLLVFIRDTVATSPAAFPGLVLPKRFMVGDGVGAN